MQPLHTTMIQYKTKPDDEQAIHSILHPLVKQWFFSRFKEFSLPQRYGIMEIHKRRNILISAPTGSTKTLTAFLAILNTLVDSAQKNILEDKIYCIYVSPLKALNEDIKTNLLLPLQEIEQLAQHSLGIRILVRTGDTSAKEKQAMLKRPPHILITTPESLAIVLSSKRFIHHLEKVEWVVIDEIHALVENKRGIQLSLSLAWLAHRSTPFSRIGLSATVAPLTSVAQFLVGYQKQKNPPPGKRYVLHQEEYQPEECIIADIPVTKTIALEVISPVKNLIQTSYQEMQTALYEYLHQQIQAHRTTLIFTNTRAATERIVDGLKERYPQQYHTNIGAHHGSLAKEHRHDVEQRLREGKMKVVVTSTSLELGIDIGSIDLVILLGSPKSVARALQRIGRSGHALHAIPKGKILVLDRDDLVECSILAHAAAEKKIDKLHLPKNALDVLTQMLYGMIIEKPRTADELYALVKESFCYHDLERSLFDKCIAYLLGHYTSLEERNIYAKIQLDEQTGMLRPKGKYARMLYMNNAGTIPEEAKVKVKVQTQIIGSIDEPFLERLQKGDIFVLGGNTYEFLGSMGMTAQVRATSGRPPTIPSWHSEMLPLSFDLAQQIGAFRKSMAQRYEQGQTKEAIRAFLQQTLPIDNAAVEAIEQYFSLQAAYAIIPHQSLLVLETIRDETQYKTVVHGVFGRRVNDALSRAIAYIIAKTHQCPVEVSISDNGFVLSTKQKVNVKKALVMLRADKLALVLTAAIEQTEILKRRFRHAATRSLMILRNYGGKTKSPGKQAIHTRMLITTTKQIDPDFIILKEARREVLEDVMDIANAKTIVHAITTGAIAIKEIERDLPSPFATMILLQGHIDLLRAEDRITFLRRMHEAVLARIQENKSITQQEQTYWNNNLQEGSTTTTVKATPQSETTVSTLWKALPPTRAQHPKQQALCDAINALQLPSAIRLELIQWVQGQKSLSQHVLSYLEQHRNQLHTWPKRLQQMLEHAQHPVFSYETFWSQQEQQATKDEEQAQEQAILDLHRAIAQLTKKNLELPPPAVVDDLFFLIQAERPDKVTLKKETAVWLEQYLKGTIPYAWSDHLVKTLQERYRQAKKEEER
ncbi:MAG: ATP-dependent helicase [Candidatus Woesearchaeota archaeon]